MVRMQRATNNAERLKNDTAANETVAQIVDSLIKSNDGWIIIWDELDINVAEILGRREFSVMTIRQPKRYGFLWLKKRLNPKIATIVSARAANEYENVAYYVDFGTMKASMKTESMSTTP
jgi:hypothetical protein